MSEWDKLCKELEEALGVYQNSPEWAKVKAEGDLNLEEKRRLLTYGGMMRVENDRLENIIHLLRRLVEDWLNQIPMTITFREKFYQIVGEPYPDWFEVPEPGLHHRQWVENNSLHRKEIDE